MKLPENTFKLVRKPKFAPPASKIGAASIAVICLLSLGAAFSVGYNASETYRQKHTERTRSIAEALPAEELASLSDGSDDISNRDFSLAKERLLRIKNANGSIESIYVTVLRGNNILFVADSEPENTPGYSRTGQVHQTASPQLDFGFRTRNAFFEGPVKSQEGTHMSSYAPLFNPDTGTFLGMLGVDTPITDYYLDIAPRILVPVFIAITASLLLWKIDHVRRKREEIVNLKNQFVSIASHELRSPLTGMLWAIQSLLNDKHTTKEQSKILNDMYKSTESSMATINEVLDLSAFERHKVTKLEKVDMDLNAAMREVIKNLKLSADEKHIALQAAGFDEAAILVGDPGAIRRSLMNIVSNAVKYSPSGSAVTCSYKRIDGWHKIKVTDHGIGIPAKDQKKVLSGYFRAKNAVKIQNTGTGLGLYVSKLIIEKHRGSLILESEEGAGTTITLRLPAKKNS